jgi:hypothetical protein
MTLTSALEDLRSTTLRTIVGGLRRLEYLSGLREGSGNYSHWGLARVHGELAAARALAEEHRQVVSNLLAMPISHLLKDLEESSQQAGVPALTYLRRLHAGGQSLLPAEPCAGYGPHLSSTLHALSCLVKARPEFSTRQAV